MPPRADLEYWQRTVGATPDGKPGPETFARTVAYLRALKQDEQPTSPGTPDAIASAGSTARARVVAWAEARLGAADPDAIWRAANSPHMCGNPGGISWCGGFTLAGLVQNLPACRDWSWGTGKNTGFALPKKLPVTSAPMPGDVVIWRRVPPGYAGKRYSSGSTTDTWHHAFFVRAEGTHIHTIDGNVLPAPSEGIDRCERVANYPVSSPYRPTFYSIAGLLAG